jgi:methyl coenzyme M reductase alpha subunit
MFKTGVYAMQQGHYISTHDQLIADKLAYVMCGGDLSAPTEVSEQYLLDLEREASKPVRRAQDAGTDPVDSHHWQAVA